MERAVYCTVLQAGTGSGDGDDHSRHILNMAMVRWILHQHNEAYNQVPGELFLEVAKPLLTAL